MTNMFDEMRAAVSQAETTLRAADSVADSMARLLRGRLKSVPGYVLSDLKRELRDFNIHTKEWKA